MVRIIWLVILDLWKFVVGSTESKSVSATLVLSSAMVPTTEQTTLPNLPEKSPVLHVAPPAAPVLLSAVTTEPHTERVEDSPTVPTVPAVATATKLEPLPVMPRIHDGSLLYIVSTDGARLYAKPHVDFDAAIAVIPYGRAVSVKGYVGRFVEVAAGQFTGYILKDDSTPESGRVWPQFVTGVCYDYDHQVTYQIRRILADEFLAGELLMPLQAGEYILTRLLRDQVSIAWPPIRPRVPGQWHQLLRGVAGIFTSVTAKTDTVMEWEHEDGVGRLAYVEAVLPDQTLRVSGVGLAVPGEYSEILLPVSMWREWRPVFMSIGV
jgi:hypothetical protein